MGRMRWGPGGAFSFPCLLSVLEVPAVDELVSVLRGAWSLLSGYSLTEQLGIVAGIAAVACVTLSGTARTAWRTARIAWGTARLGWRGGHYVLTRLQGGNLPVTEPVKSVLSLTLNAAAWEPAGGDGLQSVVEPDIILCPRRLLMRGIDVLPLLNRHERNLIRTAVAELRGRHAALSLVETAQKLRNGGQTKF